MAGELPKTPYRYHRPYTYKNSYMYINIYPDVGINAIHNTGMVI